MIEKRKIYTNKTFHDGFVPIAKKSHFDEEMAKSPVVSVTY